MQECDRIKIEKNQKETIYTNLLPNCLECSKRLIGMETIICPFSKSKVRLIAVSDSNYNLFLCGKSTNEVRSSKLFKERAITIMKAFVFFEGTRNEMLNELNTRTSRFMHNLVSLNASNIQELYSIIPQAVLAENYAMQLQLVSTHIHRNYKEAAKVFLRIAKNNLAIKSEFAIFKKLNETNPVLVIKHHPIHKVIINCLHCFYSDFTDQKVHVEVDKFEGRIPLDYESIQVVFYHLFNNATKYVMHGSTIKIYFNDKYDECDVIIEMKSLQIKKNEIDKIFEENYSGDNPRKYGLAGKGYGMSIVQKLLHLNNASITIIPDFSGSGCEMHFGKPYELNRFEVHFKK